MNVCSCVDVGVSRYCMRIKTCWVIYLSYLRFPIWCIRGATFPLVQNEVRWGEMGEVNAPVCSGNGQAISSLPFHCNVGDLGQVVHTDDMPQYTGQGAALLSAPGKVTVGLGSMCSYYVDSICCGFQSDNKSKHWIRSSRPVSVLGWQMSRPYSTGIRACTLYDIPTLFLIVGIIMYILMIPCSSIWLVSVAWVNYYVYLDAQRPWAKGVDLYICDRVGVGAC